MDNGYISPSIFAENHERCGTKILSTGDLEQINDFANRTLVPRKVWYYEVSKTLSVPAHEVILLIYALKLWRTSRVSNKSLNWFIKLTQNTNA